MMRIGDSRMTFQREVEKEIVERPILISRLSKKALRAEPQILEVSRMKRSLPQGSRYQPQAEKLVLQRMISCISRHSCQLHAINESSFQYYRLYFIWLQGKTWEVNAKRIVTDGCICQKSSLQTRFICQKYKKRDTKSSIVHWNYTSGIFEEVTWGIDLSPAQPVLSREEEVLF